MTASSRPESPVTSPREDQRLEQIWQRAYGARTPQDLLHLYRDWAATYDEDHDAIGFFGHQLAAEVLARHVPFRGVATILDAGAGTGAAGEALAAAGYRNLTAVDLSAEMLQRAKAKGVYRDVVEGDLGEPLDAFPCNHFDAAILVGVFSYGQAPARALDEIVRVVKPGGVVVFTMRVDFFEEDAMSVRSRIEELDRTQAWKQLEMTEPAQYLPLRDPDAMFRVFCYRVLETKTPPVDEVFATAVREAFTGRRRVHRIDHSFIWDSLGSRLYDRYIECPDYYLNDVETEILDDNAADILADGTLLVELGCGSANKIARLVQAGVQRDAPLTYVPVDVSQGALAATCAEVERRFDGKVEVAPRCGRFDEVLASVPVQREKLIVFFGGSIGNFESIERTVAFLGTIRNRMQPSDRFVVGIDLDKDEALLRAAYEAGPRNRAFFLNMIRRMNRELRANFDLDAFEQRSPYEPDPPFEGIEPKCVQFHLVTGRPQEVYVASMHMEVHLDAGDAIQVGTSRKFRLEDVARLGELAGLRLQRQWLDRRRFFSLNEFVPAEPR